MEKRTRNIQIKSTNSFYLEFEEMAAKCNVSVSVLGAFGLRVFLDSFKESRDKNFDIVNHMQDLLKNIDGK